MSMNGFSVTGIGPHVNPISRCQPRHDGARTLPHIIARDVSFSQSNNNALSRSKEQFNIHLCLEQALRDQIGLVGSEMGGDAETPTRSTTYGCPLALMTGDRNLPRLQATPTMVESTSFTVEQLPEFTPMTWTMSEIRSAIPVQLHVRHTWKGLLFLARDVLMAAVAWKLASLIDPTFRRVSVTQSLTPFGAEVARWSAWLAYWWFQGLIFTGLWVIGHECGHGAFSSNKHVCNVIGYIAHTLLWTPYFSWQISHHRHHSNHASVERDEVYVPKTRSDLGIPRASSNRIDYEEYFGDTPIYTLFMLLRQQLLAFLAYLLLNASGQKHYPKWTNHFDPDSILFTKRQRNAVILSNIGILTMVWGVVNASRIWGVSEVIEYYGIPWLLVTHWFVMITYLHHTDMELPHYRNKQWTFQRGAATTIDRNFLGWQGRFFLHDVAHYHVVHHFFPMMPFYNTQEATSHLRSFIGDHYRYSDKPVFKALWDTYNNCQFIEDEGDVVFYRDRRGRATVRPAASLCTDPVVDASARERTM